MTFWTLATLLAVLTALALLWPMIRQKGSSRSLSIALLIAIPLISIVTYQKVGTPEGISVTGVPQSSANSENPAADQQIEDLVQQLE